MQGKIWSDLIKKSDKESNTCSFFFFLTRSKSVPLLELVEFRGELKSLTE